MKTDAELQSDVSAELRWRSSLNAAHIGVAAKDGVVTLTGQVTHYSLRHVFHQFRRLPMRQRTQRR